MNIDYKEAQKNITQNNFEQNFNKNYIEMINALISISEYWNKDENFSSMVDACYHNSELATKTLENLQTLGQVPYCNNCEFYIESKNANGIFGFMKPDQCKKLGIYNQGKFFHCSKWEQYKQKITE